MRKCSKALCDLAMTIMREFLVINKNERLVKDPEILLKLIIKTQKCQMRNLNSAVILIVVKNLAFSKESIIVSFVSLYFVRNAQ